MWDAQRLVCVIQGAVEDDVQVQWAGSKARSTHVAACARVHMRAGVDAVSQAHKILNAVSCQRRQLGSCHPSRCWEGWQCAAAHAEAVPSVHCKLATSSALHTCSLLNLLEVVKQLQW